MRYAEFKEMISADFLQYEN